MEDHNQQHQQHQQQQNRSESTSSSNNNNTSNSSNNITASSANKDGNNQRNSSNTSSGEPMRSRWTPKPEQILILESIFNSGMVNPPKEETVRIRKMLEKFGAVGDANVFYWFQNRRSRSRRRQRQLQASLAAAAAAAAASSTPAAPPPPFSASLGGGGGEFLSYDYGGSLVVTTCTNSTTTNNNISLSSGFAQSFSSSSCPSSNNITTSTNNSNGFENVFATFSGQMLGLLDPHHNQMDTNSSSSASILRSSDDASNLEFSPGIITVFINGVATQVPEGPLDMKGMFGEEVILVHSSGVPVAFNDFGISFHSLQHGETYFLVPRLA